MAVIKYKNQKRGGMPIHFPIGCKSQAAITHRKTAAPYLEMTDEEADQLVKLDPHNFEHADPEEHEEWKKQQATAGKHKAQPTTASLSPEEAKAAKEAEKKAKAEAKAAAKAAKEAEKSGKE